MTADAWLAELTRALRQENVDGWHCDQVLAEARQHLVESGEDPVAAFGPAGSYARVVASELAGAAGTRPSVAPPLLVVEGITKSHRRQRVLQAVDLVVAAGEVVAVVGPNGAGKSTLLRICAGLEGPDAGRVTLHGAVGYCPQQPALVDLLRADEHFELVGAGRGLSRPQARRAGEELAARLDWAAAQRTGPREDGQRGEQDDGRGGVQGSSPAVRRSGNRPGEPARAGPVAGGDRHAGADHGGGDPVRPARGGGPAPPSTARRTNPPSVPSTVQVPSSRTDQNGTKLAATPKGSRTICSPATTSSSIAASSGPHLRRAGV